MTNVVTLESRVLTSGAGETQSPTFSPDGRKIAFTSRRGGKNQIYVMDLDGGNIRAAHHRGEQRPRRLVAERPREVSGFDRVRR